MMNTDSLVAIPNFKTHSYNCVRQNNLIEFFTSASSLDLSALLTELTGIKERLQYKGTDYGYNLDLMVVKNLDKINKISLLEDDWDGEGAMAFSQKAIQLFKTIIESLVEQPQITPTGRNSLLMQYEREDKSVLAFEVGENKTEAVFVPKEDFSLAQTNKYYENIAEHINEQVKLFYGPKYN